MGVQKPTRHARQLEAVPPRSEKRRADSGSVNRRAQVARATGTRRTPRDSSDVGDTRIEFGVDEGNSGYTGYDVSGIGPAGVLQKPLGREKRPGMPTSIVPEERMIHAGGPRPATKKRSRSKAKSAKRHKK